MAIVVDNIYTNGISGRVGKQLLYKLYGNKTVVSAFPRMSAYAPSERQRVQRKKFALAVLKTREWLQNKAKKQFLLGLKGKWESFSAYHAGIRYFMATPAETTTATGQNEVENRREAVQNTTAQNPKPVAQALITKKHATPPSSPLIPPPE